MDQNSISSLARDMIESSEAFADQFDRSSPFFHGGLQTIVPVGGARVPETMPTVYPEKIDDLNGYINSVEQVSYGPEYEACMRQRDFFNGPFKKVLSRVSMLGDALFRHREAFQKQGKIDDLKQVSLFEKNIQKEQLKVKEGVNEVKEFITLLEQNPKYKDRYTEVFKGFLNSQSDFINKEQVADFNFAAKRITALAFKDSQNLMEEIKQIKKLHDTPSQQSKPLQQQQLQQKSSVETPKEQQLIQEESKKQG